MIEGNAMLPFEPGIGPIVGATAGASEAGGLRIPAAELKSIGLSETRWLSCEPVTQTHTPTVTTEPARQERAQKVRITDAEATPQEGSMRCPPGRELT